MAEESADRFIRLAREHQAAGCLPSHAFGLAAFEERVENWPSGWGDHFVALVFGDFQPPPYGIAFDRLGITVEAEKVEGTVVKSALTVLRAKVTVASKTTDVVKDAARRLNLLVGALSASSQGSPIRWWSYITSPSGGSVGYRLGDGNPDVVVALVHLLPEAVRNKVTTALYWIREPRAMLLEHHRTDQLAVYAGYWNAFECLVDAVGQLQPAPRLSRDQKTEAIRERLNALATVGPSEIAAVYHEIVDPGFRAKAAHAIRTCAGDRAQQFLQQCFTYVPPDRSLYAIRNAINHGTIDIDDPETLIVIEARFPELWALVFTMLWSVLRLNASLVRSG